MELLLNVISNAINWGILIFGILLIFLIMGNAFKLGKHQSKINVVIDRKNVTSFYRKKTREVIENEEEANVTPETIRKYEKEFNKTRSLYNMYTQLIPIFPLLGILGTVAGLMSQVVAEDMDALNASLGVALGSTFWGLIFAIGLKFLVVLISERIVDNIDIMLEDFYNRFNDAIVQKNISEE